MTTLAYLIGLIDSPTNKITEPKLATNILSWLYDVEEQCPSAEELQQHQESYFSRFPLGAYFPQTPVMLTNHWSPVGALLERGLEPIILERSSKARVGVTGIWAPVLIEDVKQIQMCETDEELFWFVFAKVCKRATERGLLVSLIAQPGWAYDNPGFLPGWSTQEVEKADRVVWQRIP